MAVCRNANEELNNLLERYNTMLDGKWNQMISEIPPGYTALYQNRPEYVEEPTTRFRLPDNQRHPEFNNKIDLTKLTLTEPFRLLDGIGTDWKALQMGQPLDFETGGSINIPIPTEFIDSNAETVTICVSVVPLWLVAYDRSNRFGVSVSIPARLFRKSLSGNHMIGFTRCGSIGIGNLTQGIIVIAVGQTHQRVGWG